jgi:hypothetical protein
MYPGDDSTFRQLKESGFTTVILSSFYIHANGDVYSGDDGKNPIIHDGHYTGNKEWPARVASLKQRPGSVTRIEILLEGRWINQPPNTFDFIQDWSDEAKTIPGITTGTGANSTLYKLATGIPIYPVFLCRGSFSTCTTSHNSKTPAEIKAEMTRFKKNYPAMTGGAIWQMADVKDYIRQNCAVQYPESGSAGSVSEYLSQLKNSLKEGL